jgi:hypothetical protein
MIAQPDASGRQDCGNIYVLPFAVPADTPLFISDEETTSLTLL